jgi:hypothetical protein
MQARVWRNGPRTVMAPSALPSRKPLHPGRRPGTGQQYTASRPRGTGARARPGYRLSAVATVERRTWRSNGFSSAATTCGCRRASLPCSPRWPDTTTTGANPDPVVHALASDAAAWSAPDRPGAGAKLARWTTQLQEADGRARVKPVTAAAPAP